MQRRLTRLLNRTATLPVSSSPVVRLGVGGDKMVGSPGANLDPEDEKVATRRRRWWLYLLAMALLMMASVVVSFWQFQAAPSMPQAAPPTPQTAPPTPHKKPSAPQAVPTPRPLPSKGPNYAIIKVFYATDRQESSRQRQIALYGGGRGAISYGSCLVSMPRNHRLGVLEEPSIFRLEFREDPARHILVLSVRKKQQADFLQDLKADIRQVRRRQVLIFVHGYNVSFSDAARRTAQLKYDLAFDGPALFYSWPSQATYEGYPQDEANIEWSEPHLVNFFHMIAREAGADSIYLVAHSMGSRGTVKALNRLRDQFGERERSQFKEVVLAAPDIDAEVFREDVLPRLRTTSSRVTLYTSSKDKALRASKEFHGYRRLGDSVSGVFVGNGLDVIDATAVCTDFVGHSCFGSSNSIISDMFYLFQEGKSAGERFRLRPVATSMGTYYIFRP